MSPFELFEHQTRYIPSSSLNQETAERIWRLYGDYLNIIPPSFKNNYQWEITSSGWVGYLPVTADFGLSLQPKIPLMNLFAMWELAYQTEFRFPKGIFQSTSIQDVYEQLASVLANRILQRGHQGYHRDYLHRSAHLPYLRGKADIRRTIQRPWEHRLQCDFHEHTADIEDNQILLWTLHIIRRSGICSDRVQPVLRKSFLSLNHIVSLLSFQPGECVDRLYHRLNEDYQSLHALCHFFLVNLGPTYKIGDHTMQPFLVNMPQLYEKYVATWMARQFSNDWVVSQQEYISLDIDRRFTYDILLTNRLDSSHRIVLDTKYKDVSSPSPTDISQIVLYALMLGCTEAVLVYPSIVDKPMNVIIDGVRLRTLSFSLEENLDKAGAAFARELLEET